jgi:hypothetical protein
VNAESGSRRRPWLGLASAMNRRRIRANQAHEHQRLDEPLPSPRPEPLRRARESASGRTASRADAATQTRKVKEMALKEVKNATPTMRLEGEKMGPVTTTTMTSRAVEALRRLQGYRFLNLTTFCKSGVPVVTKVLFAVAIHKQEE